MIDLATIARDHGYRVELDESAADSPRSERPWLYRVPCKFGFISVHGPETLAAFARGRLIAGKLARVPGVRVHQRGDGEIRVLFGVECLDAVAELLGVRRRTRYSPEYRAVLAARCSRMRQTLSGGAASGPKVGLTGPGTSLPSTPAVDAF
jgi:hypothetical protein